MTDKGIYLDQANSSHAEMGSRPGRGRGAIRPQGRRSARPTSLIRAQQQPRRGRHRGAGGGAEFGDVGQLLRARAMCDRAHELEQRKDAETFHGVEFSSARSAGARAALHLATQKKSAWKFHHEQTGHGLPERALAGFGVSLRRERDGQVFAAFGKHRPAGDAMHEARIGDGDDRAGVGDLFHADVALHARAFAGEEFLRGPALDVPAVLEAAQVIGDFFLHRLAAGGEERARAAARINQPLQFRRDRVFVQADDHKPCVIRHLRSR